MTTSNPKTKHPSTTGADEHAPFFSDYVRRVQEIEAQLDREMAEVRLGAIRRECERASKAEKREARLRKVLWAAATLAAVEAMALLWLVTR